MRPRQRRPRKGLPRNKTVKVERPAGQLTHDQLVAIAGRFLQRFCGVVVTEMTSSGPETPDALGWRTAGISLLVECKASRADFRADAGKAFRAQPWMGMGDRRYYLAPSGLIKPGELPPGWGLIEVDAQGRTRVARMSRVFERQVPGLAAERALLLSALRRQAGGVSVKAYAYQTKNRATLGVAEDVLTPDTVSGATVKESQA